MNKQAPKEYFSDLAADLALCIADCLEHDDCPPDLIDALNEITDPLMNAIAPSPGELLRALAGLAKTRDRETRPEIETHATAKYHATAAALNGASGK